MVGILSRRRTVSMANWQWRWVWSAVRCAHISLTSCRGQLLFRITRIYRGTSLAEMIAGGSFFMDILTKKEYDKYKIGEDFF